MDGNDHQVQQHLLNLGPVSPDNGNIGTEAGLNVDMTLRVTEHFQGVFNQAIQVDLVYFGLSTAGVAKQLAGEFGAPLDNLVDNGQSLLVSALGGELMAMISTLPWMPASILLKSWAMPPARVPTASIFWDWINWRSVFLRLVMSLTLTTGTPGRPVLQGGCAVLRETAARWPSGF